MRRVLALLIALCLLFAGAEAAAGIIRLKNGDEITGRILKRTADNVEVETQYGKLTIPRNTIAAIVEQVRVFLKDGGQITGEIISRTGEEVRLKTVYADEPVSIPARGIERIAFIDEKGEEKKLEPQPEPEKKEAPSARDDIRELRRQANRHLQEKEWEKAVEVYEKILEAAPEDSNALYNCACACSLLGKSEKAVAYLRRAVKAGFVDFGHIERDADLDNIREEEGYKKLLEEKDKLLDGAVDKNIERYKKRLGDEYRYIKDEDYKLAVISNVSQQRLDGLISALRAYAECHWKDFFRNKPSYYITVLIPTDFQEYSEKFGGRSGAAGFYNPGSKTLTVNLATGGGTMIHEFTHALHYADMEGLGQRHPIWVVEGFGSLYEQCTRRGESGFGLLNWRLPILKRAIAGQSCFPLKDFISSSGRYFRQDQSLSYAIARYVFYFLQEKKLLRRWYAKYRENYESDRTGLETLEELYGKSIEEFEKDWLEFLKPLEYNRGGDSNRPFIGVQLEEMDEGLRIAEVVDGSPANRAGLKIGDVILKMEELETKTLSALRAVVEKHKIGDEIKLVVKRNGEKIEINLKLGKRQ